MTQKSTLDWPLTLQRLNGNTAMAKEILQIFLTELPELHRRINEAFEKHEIKTLYDQLHRLYGSCCYLAVPTLKDATKQFMDAVTTVHHDAALQAILASFNNAVQEMLKAAESGVFSQNGFL